MLERPPTEVIWMPSNTSLVCIYCENSKPAHLFNKEHVFPQAFGKFQNNFTLVDMVCQECNNYFGKTLDMDLGRESWEGLKRFEHGVKRLSEFSHFGKK